MNKILRKEQFANDVYCLEVEAPQIARSCRAGNFVIIRVDEKSARMPYNITKVDPSRGSISIILQANSVSSTKLSQLSENDNVADIVGPLGSPSKIENFGTVVCAGETLGNAALLPVMEALKAVGNKVVAVLSGATKEQIIMADEAKAVADEVIVMTEDGSMGNAGAAVMGVAQVMGREQVDKVYVFGSPKMMQAVSTLAKERNIANSIYLNTIMLDGAGMCGACRITVGERTKFVCIDGPEFDGNAVNWDEVIKRTQVSKGVKRQDIGLLNKENKTDSAAFEGITHNEETLEMITDRDAEWRQALRKAMKPKERTAIKRVEMPMLDPTYRATTRMEEVSKGLTLDMAINEAHRCLDCAKPTCVQGCPVHNDIPSFIKNIERGDILNAAKVLKSTSSLPAICGRVCPQEKQCEGSCIHLKMKSEAVAIGNLERFIADYERESGNITPIEVAPANGIKVAVVGSGPAGLSFAGDMAKQGFDVYVFEALHKLGGVLKYGIPEFRLPNRIVDVEIENLRRAGVHFQTDTIVGKTVTIDELRANGFKGFFVGSGAGVPNFMGIPGENAINIMSSNEYLTRLNLMDAANPESETPIFLGKKVIIIGGGNTAMDSCRTAKRLGAEVTVVYRRSEEEMPAGQVEIREAKEEGINFLTLHNPKEYLTDEEGKVKGVILDVMELGEPDESGRRSPKKTGKTIELVCDQAIVAVGVLPNSLVPKSIEGLELGWKDTIVVNEEMQSSNPEIYAGGDIVHGPATVVLAMGDGRKAAKSMGAALLK